MDYMYIRFQDALTEEGMRINRRQIEQQDQAASLFSVGSCKSLNGEGSNPLNTGAWGENGARGNSEQ